MLIVRGFASSRTGSLIVSTPFLYSAPILVASTVFGSENDRTKLPYARSTRWKLSCLISLSSLRSPRIVSVLFSTLTSISSRRMSGSSALSTSAPSRSEEHTSELQSRLHLVCRLLLEKKKKGYVA